MPANNSLRITEIDFDTIKANLKTFLRNQDQFADYDFNSSALSVLIDMLSYNTYMNSYYLNMALNESRLSTAQLRNSVVLNAKSLDYTPVSNRGAKATVNLTITPTGNPTTINIARDTQFVTTIDDIQYTFVTATGKVINANANGIFSTNIELIEGIPLQHEFTASDGLRYIIPNENVDTTSLRVYLRESSSNSQLTTLTLADDITTVNSISNVYYLQENENKRYEIYFGDDILGRSIQSGNIVRINYRVSNGTVTNGANTFTPAGTVGGYSDVLVQTVSSASGGANQESIDSIRFNAPKNYETQNRAVISNDYARLIRAMNPDITAISVWGGEENNPPIYGKVFIAAKPNVGNLLSAARKDQIVTQLKAKNVLSINPEFVDATFLYVIPTITVRYNPSVTSLSASQIAVKIKNAVIDFESTRFNQFGKNFYYSEFMKKISDSESSLQSILIDVQMMKQFVPNRTNATTYRLNFNNAIKHDYDGALYSVTSSPFTYQNRTCFLDDNGSGIVRIYYLDGLNRRYLNNNAGTVDYTTGLITLSNVLIQQIPGTEFKIKVKPSQQDIYTVRNQIILLSDSTIFVYNNDTGDLETTVTEVQTAGLNETLLESGINSTII